MLRRIMSFYGAVPIPVLSIVNICDIGIDVEHIFIEGKLSKADAKKFDFSLFDCYDFDIYWLRTALRTITRPPAQVSAQVYRIQSQTVMKRKF